MIEDVYRIYRVYRALAGNPPRPRGLRETAPGVWTAPETERTATDSELELIQTADRVAAGFNKVRNAIGKVNAIPEAKGDGEICPKL